MLTDEQRLKVYGSAEAVAAADRYIEDLVAAMPPLTQRQKDALRVLLRPAAAVEQPAPKPLRRRRAPARETTTAAPAATGTAA